VLAHNWNWIIGYWWYLPVFGRIGVEWYFHWLWCWTDSSWRCPQDNHLEVCGVVGASRWRQWQWGGLKCKLCSGQHTW